jgi:NAD(P)-binding Rossmann-like domain
VLSPADVVEAARVRTSPGLYALGMYDTRITFYSQQVRALELAHALQHEHLLAENARVAVIGGGAAGLTLASALALQGGTTVHLYEKAHRLLPLQGDSQRRRLDPHIYDWPGPDADHELAQLPILDWRSASAVNVREAVLREFGEVRRVTGARLSVFEGHSVTNLTHNGRLFNLTFERDVAGGARVPASQIYDVVILAIGFGIEPRFAIPLTDTASYWLDAGVPGADIDGNPRPTFLISGNGDGGLIDLIASASSSFRHDDIVLGIAQRAGVEQLRDALLAIDEQAMAEEAAGREFDFIGAYERDIGAQIEAMGLVDDMLNRMRPGVQLILQTRTQKPLSIRTARLNRLAVFLLRKACERPNAACFTHLSCDDAVLIQSEPGDAPGSRRFQCGPDVVVADWVIARRGPERDQVRQPFGELLVGHEADHEAWVNRHPIDSIAPKLNAATYDHYKRLADSVKLPPPLYRFAEMAAGLPRSGKLWMVGGDARWSGDLPLGDVAALWSDDRRQFDLTVAAGPDELGPDLAHAVARTFIHAPRSNLLGDVARWRPFLTKLASESSNIGGIQDPHLRAPGNALPSTLHPQTMRPDALALAINCALDRWLIDEANTHLARYLEQGRDPGHAVSFTAAADLRQQMRPIWATWMQQFQADPALLSRFFALTVCAKDGPAVIDEASVLAGRLTRIQVIRVCAVALAVATAWQVTAPYGAYPGNLQRDADGNGRSGHACAAGYIDSEDMSLTALRHAWTTEFVLLPMERFPPALVGYANTSLNKVDSGALLLGQLGAASKLVLTVDSRFVQAASNSAAALHTLLQDIETEHFAQLRAEVE